VELQGLLSFPRTSLLAQLLLVARLTVCITMTISVVWVWCEGFDAHIAEAVQCRH
jgi:hypothetical protein